MDKKNNIRKIMRFAGKEIPKEEDFFLSGFNCIREIDPEIYDRIESGDINPFYNLLNSKEDHERIWNLVHLSWEEEDKKEVERLNKIKDGKIE